MKLIKYKEKNKTLRGGGVLLLISIILIIGIVSYQVFIHKRNLKEENNSNSYIAFYIDDSVTNTMPSKDSGYVYDEVKSNCTNGASPEFNKDDWSVKVKDMTKTRTKCTIYFKQQTFGDIITDCGKDGKTATTCLLENASKDTINLAYDNTVDNNLRYIGANPNNYVTFNNELWRIIGVMNNVEDGSGTKASCLKLIKESKIGNYSWDNKASGTGSSTSELGSNDWRDSPLQEVLNNGAYYNRTSGTCPYGQNGATTACDFTSNGLTPEAKTMIENIKWKLGGTNSFTTASDGLTSHFYGYERGTVVYSGRPTEWIGKVGLMYPSDYGYATSGGATTNREACLAKELLNWNAAEVSDCKNNDWLYNSSNYQWTLSPHSSISHDVFNVSSTGFVSNPGYASYVLGVSPALYLLFETKLSSGNGTSIDPFTLTIS